MSENVCDGDHRSHLCALAGGRRLKAIKELVQNPAYMCGNCGRVADSDKHVCNPQPLKEG